LSPQLKSLSGFSGCTIMGDGHVALILDVLGLAQRAHVVSEVQEQQGVGEGTSHLADTREPTETLLILKVGHEGRAAVSLAAVDRLEEFKREDLERTAGRDVVQYRDTILPLVDIGASLGYAPTDEYTDTVQVVVYSNAGRMIGFVADRIVDIVEQVITIQQKSDQPGIVGSLVVQGAVTDLLDIEEIVRSVAPFYETLEEVVTSV
jgi:two-component system chemotaxis sensor kinase CheA